uniref:Probable nicotinate-nucleotide adenylyltransferase n=1 Tax=uncultured Armatimonadetes bacterium TaxID=157466 RepID=A0A6J4IQC9_9BACT|nr:Nicotinate-nucleotide adenylyltransferase [uncultured Armatimonadetes bacterium]
MRIGIFGGTFDPIHLGHLRLAEETREQLQLDRVLFVPNNVSPFKDEAMVTPGERRIEMIWRAVADNPHFEVSAVEVRRPGPSYAIDTLRALRAECPVGDFFFLTGTDAVRDLAGWREPEALMREARFVAACRPGTEPDEVRNALPPHWAERVTFIAMPGLDISATDLRARVRARRSITYLVPRAVEEYILANGLYSDRAPQEDIS